MTLNLQAVSDSLKFCKKFSPNSTLCPNFGSIGMLPKNGKFENWDKLSPPPLENIFVHS